MPPGIQLSYGNPRLMRTMFLQLQQQQLAGLFCDLTLKGEGEGIHVHSCLLAACSPYLTNLLGSLEQITVLSSGYQNQTEISRRVLNMPGFSSNALFALVRYMYTSELAVSPSEVHEVLTAARVLRIPEVEVLNLENGRLVRSDAGKRINRASFQQRTVKVNSLTESRMSQQNQTVRETSKDWVAGRVSAGLHEGKLVNEGTPLQLLRDPQSRTVMAEENRALQIRSTGLIHNPHATGAEPNNIVLAANETSRRPHRNTKVDDSFLEQQGDATNQNLNKEGKLSTVRQTIAAQLALKRQGGVVEAVRIQPNQVAGPSGAQESGADKECEKQLATLEQDRASMQIRAMERSQSGGDGTSDLSRNQESTASTESKLKQDKAVVDPNQRHAKEAKQNKDSPSRSESCRKTLDGPITVAMLNQGRATMAEIGQSKEVHFPEIKKDHTGGALLTNSFVKPQSNLNRDQKNPPSQTLTREEDNMAKVSEAILDKEGSDIVSQIKNCGSTVTEQTKETPDRSPVAKLVLKKKTMTSLSNRRCIQKGGLAIRDLNRGTQVTARRAKQSIKHSMSSINELNMDERHDHGLGYRASLCDDEERQAGMSAFGSKEYLATIPESSHDKVNSATVAKPNQGEATVTESSPRRRPITEPSSGDKSRTKMDTPVGMESRRASEQNQANYNSVAVLLSPRKNESVYTTGLNQWKEEATITKRRRNMDSNTAEIEKHGTAVADENEDKGAAEKSTKRQRETTVAKIGKPKPRRDTFSSPSRSNRGSVVVQLPNKDNPASTLTVESPTDKQEELEKRKGIPKRETTAYINPQVEEETNGCEEAAGTGKLRQWACEARKDKPSDSTVTSKDFNEPEVEFGLDKNLISTGDAISTSSSRQTDRAEENILLQQEELMGNQDKEIFEGKCMNMNTGTCRNQQEQSEASRDVQGKAVHAVEERIEMVALASRGVEICSPKTGVHKNIPKKSSKMEEHMHPNELTGKGAAEASKKSQSRTVKRGKYPHIKERKVKRIRHVKAAKLVQDRVTTAGNVGMEGKNSGANKAIDNAIGEKRTRAVDVDLNGNRCLSVPPTKTEMANLHEPLSVQRLQFPNSQTIAKPSNVDFGMSRGHSDQQLVEPNHSGLISKQNQGSINTNAVNQIPKPQQRKVVCAETTPIKVAVNELSERRLSVQGEELEDGGVLVDRENLPKEVEPERTLRSDCGVVHPTTCSLQDSAVKEIKAAKSTFPESVTNLSERMETQNVYSMVSKNEGTLEPSNLDENGNQEKKRCWSSVEPEEGIWVKESRSRNIQVELFVAQERNEVSRSHGKDEYLSELEDLLEQMLNDPSTSSPELDVGRYSPAGTWCVGMRPDLSSESDTEVDVLD